MQNQQKTLKAVIIAAGAGLRIQAETNGIPKTLLPFGNESILSTILKNIGDSGINNFVIVVGYKSELIKQYLDKNNNFGFNISFVMNEEWHRGNGISVLLAEECIADECFILSMSDHIVSTEAVKRLVDHKSESNLLLVDRDVDAVFDIDDATKVELIENRIINIGKEIQVYNGIDCGVFRLNINFFNAMREQLKNGQESISAAVKILIKNHNMSAVFTAEGDYWQDVDTPEAYKYALDYLAGKLQIKAEV